MKTLGPSVRIRTAALATALILACTAAWAVAPVAPDPVTLTQPDGTTFTGYPKGSGYVDWMETAEGHTVLPVEGWWHYAEEAPGGEIRPSPHRVGSLGEADLEAWPLHLHAPPDLSKAPRLPRRVQAPQGVTRAPDAVSQPLLLLLVSFTDTAFAYSESSFVTLIYGASSSVKHYYTQNSYGTFGVLQGAESSGTANDGAVSVTLTYAHPNFGSTYGASHDLLVKDAILASDPYVNYAAYDTNGDGAIVPQELSILMIIAGYEMAYGGAGSLTPRVWAHAGSIASASGATVDGKLVRYYGMFGERHGTSSGTHQATIGVMCHELGHHFLSLPDLYDTDGTSEGIGNWGLMGAGSWNYSGGYSGNSPAHFTAWDKADSGFLVPEEIPVPTASVVLAPASTSASVKRLWVDKYRHGESFLLENRPLSGYDAGLPGGGLLITHIDDLKATNRDEAHKLVDVEEADGLTQMDTKVNRGDAGDPWPGSTAKTAFTDATTPSTRDYSGAATAISVSNIHSAGSDMVVDVTPKPLAQMCDNVGYDDGGVSGSSRGYGNTVIWTALRVTNTTGMNTLDGVDLYQNDSGVTGYTIDFYLYSTVSVSGTPGTLLHTQTGLAGTPGWNRLLLAAPQPFPPGEERAIVLKITGNTASAVWARYDPYGALSDRSFIDSNGTPPLLQPVVLRRPQPEGPPLTRRTVSAPGPRRDPPHGHEGDQIGRCGNDPRPHLGHDLRRRLQLCPPLRDGLPAPRLPGRHLRPRGVQMRPERHRRDHLELRPRPGRRLPPLPLVGGGRDDRGDRGLLGHRLRRHGALGARCPGLLGRLRHGEEHHQHLLLSDTTAKVWGGFASPFSMFASSLALRLDK